jgi:hypothetical protein
VAANFLQLSLLHPSPGYASNYPKKDETHEMADKSLRYESLRAIDEHDEIDDLEARLHDVDNLDETIDLEDLDDKDYMRRPEPRSRWRRFVDAMTKYWWLVDGLLLLVVILLLVDRRVSSQCSQTSSQTTQTSANTLKYQGTGDITGFAPQCKLGTRRESVRHGAIRLCC